MGKGKVEFTDRSADTIKAMQGLAKKGLRAAGNVVKKQALANMSQPQRDTVGKLVIVRAVVDKTTGQARAEVGYLSKTSSSRYKKKAKDVKFMPNPSWIEFGTRPHRIVAGHTHKGPTGKRALSNGDTLYGVSFTHPGSRGHKPVTNAGAQKGKEADAAMLPFLQQIATMSDSDVVREALSAMEELEEDD